MNKPITLSNETLKCILFRYSLIFTAKYDRVLLYIKIIFFLKAFGFLNHSYTCALKMYVCLSFHHTIRNWPWAQYFTIYNSWHTSACWCDVDVKPVRAVSTNNHPTFAPSIWPIEGCTEFIFMYCCFSLWFKRCFAFLFTADILWFSTLPHCHHT